MVNLKPQLRGVPKQPLGASRAALAEYGTFTLEFMALSHRTGDPEFGQKAEAIILGMHKRDPTRVRARCCQQPARLADVGLGEKARHLLMSHVTSACLSCDGPADEAGIAKEQASWC